MKFDDGKTRWTNADLREMFDLFNSRYFSNKLKIDSIRFEDIDGLGRSRTLYDRSGRLSGYSTTISRKLRWSRRMWASTLLHEMVHVEDKLVHSCGINGHIFNRRMKELANRGAFNGLW